MSITNSYDYHHGHHHNSHSHPSKRNSSVPLETIHSRSLTVTKNVNNSIAVSEEHRVQASEYLAPYIEACI